MRRVFAGILLSLLAPGGAAEPAALLCNEFRMGGVEEAMRTHPGHDRACHEHALALLRRAGAHDHRLREAEGIFRTLLRLRPQSAFAYAGFAELKMRRRELGQSMEESVSVIRDEAERATRIEPVLPDAFVTLGRAELLAGCVPCASRAVEVARALDARTPALAELRARLAEIAGHAEGARVILQRAIAAPGVAPASQSWLGAVLAELEVRQGRFAEADRALSEAVAATPDEVSLHIRRAEVRLYGLGDLDAALSAAGADRRASSTVELKRIRDMFRYVQWSRDPGREAEELRRIVQASYLGPEDAAIICARHPALSSEFGVMLQARLLRSIDSRDGAGDTALLAAVAGGNREVARLLIEGGADVDAADRRGRRPLSFAVERSDRDILGLLLKAGAVVDFVDKDGRSPLRLAAQKADGASAVLLLDHRAAQRSGLPDDAGDLLATAAAQGDVVTMRALLDAGIPADTVDGRGDTALIVAVRWNRPGAARLLLEHGADAARALGAAQEAGDGAMRDLLRSFIKRTT